MGVREQQKHTASKGDGQMPVYCYWFRCIMRSSILEHSVQDEEHIILGCPSQDLANLRTQFQHLFNSAPPSSASRLREFGNQANILGIAKSVSACLKCCN
eukprot:1160211-Pelagomonas_calceolata.AAC.1